MKPQRTLPPAAAPIYVQDIIKGILSVPGGNKERQGLTNKCKKLFGVKHCFFVSSGKAALYCIVKALQQLYPDKNEIVIPAFNCYSVPSALKKTGCSIRLCDVDTATLDFDELQLKQILGDNKRLLCVIPTHLFGLHAKVKELRSVINDNTVTLIEDAAQAMGSIRGGELLGLSGDVGFFSLGRGKAFSTYEGGVIVTNNDVLGNKISEVVAALPEYPLHKILSLMVKAIAVTVLSRPSFFWIPKSLPFLKLGETVFEHSFDICALSSFQAGLAGTVTKKLHRLMAERKQNIAWYASYFQNNPIPGVYSFVNFSKEMPDPIRFPVRIDSVEMREVIMRKSEEKGLGISTIYPTSLDELPEIADTVVGEFPNARACAQQIITLPVHCFVTKRDREEITELIASVCKKFASSPTLLHGMEKGA